MTTLMGVLDAGAPFVAALFMGLAAYWLVDAVQVGRTAARQLADFKPRAEEQTFTERLGDWVAAHSPIPLKVSEWQENIRWAQRAGQLQGVTVSRMLGEAVIYTVLGYAAVFAFRAHGLALWLSPLLLGAYPLLRVKNRAGRVYRTVHRVLPETAGFIAAEMAAGNSAEQALMRAAEGHNPLGRFLAEALDFAQRTGRPVFSNPPVEGALVEYARQEAKNLPGLRAFVRQLDMVARKGVSGAQLMVDIAQTLAREHHQEVMQAAKTLDSKLVVAAAVFYFMPFVALLLFAFAAPVIRMFSGG
ncbi:MAG TPA: hypothetical protein ENJ54_00105 [Chloroflexi bacterium]|nr:hypothetical protein [Chloroflexota bacterium]